MRSAASPGVAAMACTAAIFSSESSPASRCTVSGATAAAAGTAIRARTATTRKRRGMGRFRLRGGGQTALPRAAGLHLLLALVARDEGAPGLGADRLLGLPH